MAFPVTIDSIARTPEAPARYGPFLVGSAVYVITATEDLLLGDFLLAQKSTDNGVTWTEVDAANRPVPSGTQCTCCQSSADPTQIYVIYTDSITGMTTVQLFNAGTDLWGAVLGAALIGGVQTAAYRAADNSLVVIGATSTPDSQHNIPAFSVFDIGLGTFGAVTPMDFLDYADPTLWDQKACGIVLRSDGAVTVFSQQATRRTLAQSPTVIDFTPGSSSPWQVPFDCPVIDLVETYGAGGGGGGAGGADNGGGGGGGYRSAAAVPVTPLDNIPFVVGAGGAQNTDGGDSSFNGALIAGGGKLGVVTAGGAGGAGDNAGGKGGDGLGTAGGGGGGCGGPTTPGVPGNDSDGTNRGTGGAGGGGQAGSGGAGGQLLGTLVDGVAGSPVGAGGGGASSDGGLNIGDGGAGADGALRITYTPFTNSHVSRMWQQSIRPDNSLTVLTEIAEGEFPIDGGGAAGLVPFDCKAGDGFVVVVFAWVTATGVTQMLAGRADNADVLAFTFQTVDIDNGTSGIDPGPALCITPTGAVHLCYVSAADLTTVRYMFRRDIGLGFGAARLLGTFADSGCRLQTAFLAGLTMGVFGRPTTAFVDFVGAS